MSMKTETPIRKARRKYEEINKEERKQTTEQFNTRLPRKDFEEIDAFLKKHGLTKVELLYEGYMSLKAKYANAERDLKKSL